MLMNTQPKCSQSRQASLVCVTETCHHYPFMCGKCQGNICQSSHKFCKTMQWSAALERINFYEKYQTKQLLNYIKRVEHVFDNLSSRIKKEKQRFREFIQNRLYAGHYQKVKYHIEKKEFEKMLGRDLGHLMTKMTSQYSSYSVQGFYVNQMKLLDKQMMQLFQQIEAMYKKKLRNDWKYEKVETSREKLSMSQTLKSSRNRAESTSSLQKKSPPSLSINLSFAFSHPRSIPSYLISSPTSLNYFLSSKIKSYKLIFRASEQKFSIEKFYQLCSNSSNTLILAKTQYNKIIGGFTKIPWRRQIQDIESDDECDKANKYRQDVRGSTFLFSIDQNEKYQLYQAKYAIYCGKNSIGFGKDDLRIVNHANKHNKNKIGFPNSFNNGLYLPIQKSSLILSGSRNSNYFRIKEWQVFEVVFGDKK